MALIDDYFRVFGDERDEEKRLVALRAILDRADPSKSKEAWVLADAYHHLHEYIEDREIDAKLSASIPVIKKRMLTMHELSTMAYNKGLASIYLAVGGFTMAQFEVAQRSSLGAVLTFISAVGVAGIHRSVKEGKVFMEVKDDEKDFTAFGHERVAKAKKEITYLADRRELIHDIAEKMQHSPHRALLKTRTPAPTPFDAD